MSEKEKAEENSQNKTEQVDNHKNLKRQLSNNENDDDDDYKLSTVNLELKTSINCTLESINDSLNNTIAASQANKKPARASKKVAFKNVNLYLFERTQGFQSIPSDTYESSITLGMAYKHSELERFESIDDYLKFKRTVHLNKLEEEVNKNGTNAENENEDLDYINKLNDILKNKDLYENNIDLDLPISSDIFCPILSPDERLAKLDEFGVSQNDLDLSESGEINNIKEARYVNVGCKCKQMNMVCGENGDLCSCASNGIPCQLDRTRYPCECTLKKCQNPHGIKRFDQKNVVKHRMNVLSGQNSYHVNDKNDKISYVKELSATSILATPEIKRKKRRRKSSGSYPDYSKKRKKSANIKIVSTKNDDNSVTNAFNSSPSTMPKPVELNVDEPIKPIDVNIIIKN